MSTGLALTSEEAGVFPMGSRTAVSVSAQRTINPRDAKDRLLMAAIWTIQNQIERSIDETDR